MTPEVIIHALHGKRSGSRWMCYCPCHESDGRDHNPSLSIREKDGKILVHCHGGCDQQDVIAALRDRGLWPEHDHEDGHIKDWRTVATYPYVDEHGTLLYEIGRPTARGGKRSYVNLRIPLGAIQKFLRERSR